MSQSAFDPPYDRFMATADQVAADREDVDPSMAREVFAEVATLLYNGLARDGLDEHDTAAVVDGLCVDLIAKDPGAAIRARSKAVSEDRVELHDPQAVSRAYLICAGLMQL
jgi:hypothetical protein